jgi:hypothetical protein
VYTLLGNGQREVGVIECLLINALSRPVNKEICIDGPFKGPGLRKKFPKVADVLETDKRPMALVILFRLILIISC